MFAKAERLSPEVMRAAQEAALTDAKSKAAAAIAAGDFKSAQKYAFLAQQHESSLAASQVDHTAQAAEHLAAGNLESAQHSLDIALQQKRAHDEAGDVK